MADLAPVKSAKAYIYNSIYNQSENVVNCLKFKTSNILYCLFAVTLLFLTRQCPLSSLSFIMNICLFSFFLLSLNDIAKALHAHFVGLVSILNIMLLLFLVLYSFFIGNDTSLILRSFIILLLLCYAYLVKPRERYIKLFLFFIFIQAIFIIGFEIYMITNFNQDTYLPLRHVFLNNNWGDVYTFNGYLWKIQLRGNALIPFAFFISVLYYNGLRRYTMSGLFLVASIVSGNFAFIVGIVFFTLGYLLIKHWTLNQLIMSMLFIVFLGPIMATPVYEYITTTIDRKAKNSNAKRFDQINVLANDMNSGVASIFFGRGLGNTISKKTRFRDYTGRHYYELQALYVLNQVGCIYFTLFVLLNIILTLQFIKYTKLILTYVSYILYASFNPYILDTSHIVVIVILVSLSGCFMRPKRIML